MQLNCRKRLSAMPSPWNQEAGTYYLLVITHSPFLSALTAVIIGDGTGRMIIWAWLKVTVEFKSQLPNDLHNKNNKYELFTNATQQMSTAADSIATKYLLPYTTFLYISISLQKQFCCNRILSRYSITCVFTFRGIRLCIVSSIRKHKYIFIVACPSRHFLLPFAENITSFSSPWQPMFATRRSWFTADSIDRGLYQGILSGCICSYLWHVVACAIKL